jgi:hypothetical protein
MQLRANQYVSKCHICLLRPISHSYTFRPKPAEAKGVHDVREASDHQSDRYSWRNVKPDRQSLAEAGRVLIQLLV